MQLRLKKRSSGLCAVILFVCAHAAAQEECPPNIGFETEDFSNWQCSVGSVNTSNGSLTFLKSNPTAGRHTMISSASYQQTDVYGGFNITAPNGSNNSILLGNAVGGNGTERVSYTFQVPANVKDYSLLYYYAVVFFNPPKDHVDWEQPKFSVKVLDISGGTKITCASVDYTSSANIPGFMQSNVNTDVYYKSWTPVTINLSGYEGRTLMLEFTTNDCAKPNGRHFGYAYVDVNENCASPISGNTICPNVTDKITLVAPEGFMQYNWYDANFTKILGNTNTLVLSPPPPVNTGYAVKVIPFPDSGCPDTLFTLINSSSDPVYIKAPDEIAACRAQGVNLTSSSITMGSSPNLKFSYYTDSTLKVFVPNSRNVTTSGTYYIKASSPAGCFSVKPVKITVYDSPQLQITNPFPVCTPATVDITLPAITAGSTNSNILSYWTDPEALTPLTNPKAIAEGGTYYIKAFNKAGCADLMPVVVTIGEIPVFTVQDQQLCIQADLSKAIVIGDVLPKMNYTYWSDSACTIPVSSPKAVTVSGAYYIKGVTPVGCFSVAKVNVLIYPVPNLVISKPLIVIPYLNAADLTTAITVVNGLSYSYWLDQKATKPVINPTSIKVGGMYYVKAVNDNSCSDVLPIKVFVDAPPGFEVTAINTFTPNGDGTNDAFNLIYNGTITPTYFKIFNRYGELAFNTVDISESWDGKKEGKELPVGTYYWVFNGYDEYHKRSFTSSGSITLIR